MYKYIRSTSYVGLFLFLGAITIYTGITWDNVSEITHPECIDPIPLEKNHSPIENWLTTQDGYSIRIWHYPTENGAVVLVFGDNQGALGKRLPPIETLLYYGFGVIQVDTRACAKPSAPVTLGVNEFFDAEAALKFARSLPNYETHRFGVFGFDMGCTTALMLTIQHPEIQGVVCDGGFASPDNLLSSFEQVIFSLQTGVDPQNISLVNDIPKLKPDPVFFIFGEFEARTGLTLYDSALEPKELWLVPLGSHGRNHIVDPGTYAAYIVNFFRLALLD